MIRKWLEFWLAFALQWKFQSQGASVTLPRSQRYTRAISLQPFFGGSADFEINFWHSKRKLMAFSCLIHFSSVPPQCVMLWWSREKFFSRHYRDVKLYRNGSCLKWGPLRYILYKKWGVHSQYSSIFVKCRGWEKKLTVLCKKWGVPSQYSSIFVKCRDWEKSLLCRTKNDE